MRHKFTILALLSLFLAGGIVQAAVPSPAEAFSGLGTFFVGLFTGTASMENAYFLTMILYFIIFFSLFVEGLKRLPLFGEVGGISTPGKWFAGAAAGLSTFAIFTVERQSGKTISEVMSSTLGPWGVYGGVAVAGILAFIAYKMLKDTKIFKDSVLVPMAVALAVGLLIAGSILSMPTIFGWGWILTLVVVILGLVMAKKSGSKEKKEESTAEKAENEVNNKKADELEKTEEAFTLQEAQDLKKVEGAVKSTPELVRNAPTDGRGRKDYRKVINYLKAIEERLGDEKRLGRKGRRAGRKLRRALPEQLKKDEEKNVALIQVLTKGISNVRENIKEMEKELEQAMKEGKTVDLESFAKREREAVDRIQNLEKGLAALFKLEESLKKKREALK